jgi:hypothetical protein
MEKLKSQHLSEPQGQFVLDRYFQSMEETAPYDSERGYREIALDNLLPGDSTDFDSEEEVNAENRKNRVSNARFIIESPEFGEFYQKLIWLCVQEHATDSAFHEHVTITLSNSFVERLHGNPALKWRFSSFSSLAGIVLNCNGSELSFKGGITAAILMTAPFQIIGLGTNQESLFCVSSGHQTTYSLTRHYSLGRLRSPALQFNRVRYDTVRVSCMILRSTRPLRFPDLESLLCSDKGGPNLAFSEESKVYNRADRTASEIDRPDIKQLKHTARSRLLINVRLFLCPTFVYFLQNIGKSGNNFPWRYFFVEFCLAGLYIHLLSQVSSSWRDPHRQVTYYSLLSIIFMILIRIKLTD